MFCCFLPRGREGPKQMKIHFFFSLDIDLLTRSLTTNKIRRPPCPGWGGGTCLPFPLPPSFMLHCVEKYEKLAPRAPISILKSQKLHLFPLKTASFLLGTPTTVT